jgi:hypothetical protein
MGAISKAFAKAIVKMYKLTIWDPQNTTNKFEDTSYIEFTKEDFNNIFNQLGTDAEKVRIYVAKYPKSVAELNSITNSHTYFKPKDYFSAKEKQEALTDYLYVTDPKRSYENHNTLVFIGVDADDKEIFDKNGQSLMTAIAAPQILAVENHGDLVPPNPPTDSNTLYNICYVS